MEQFQIFLQLLPQQLINGITLGLFDRLFGYAGGRIWALFFTKYQRCDECGEEEVLWCGIWDYRHHASIWPDVQHGSCCPDLFLLYGGDTDHFR